MNDEFSKAEQEIKEAWKEIADGRQSLTDGEAQLAEKEELAKKEFEKAHRELEENLAEIRKNEKKLDQAEAELSQGESRLKSAKDELGIPGSKLPRNRLVRAKKELLEQEEQTTQAYAALVRTVRSDCRNVWFSVAGLKSGRHMWPLPEREKQRKSRRIF